MFRGYKPISALQAWLASWRSSFLIIKIHQRQGAHGHTYDEAECLYDMRVAPCCYLSAFTYASFCDEALSCIYIDPLTLTVFVCISLLTSLSDCSTHIFKRTHQRLVSGLLIISCMLCDRGPARVSSGAVITPGSADWELCHLMKTWYKITLRDIVNCLSRVPARHPTGFPRSHHILSKGLDFSLRMAYSERYYRVFVITSYIWFKCSFDLKKMKELEQEKDSLLAGLDVLDRAKEWYQTQIHNVIETQRHVGQSHSTVRPMTDQEVCRLDVLLPKLQDVTHCLSDLISFSATTFPSAVVSPPVSVPAPSQAIQVLKEQNRLLTQEVSEKSDRITQLEQEKSALIKQLFEARARNTHDSSALDSTFI
ncbi:Suppressor APC domain-containing protein 2 [Triplophysa tibetana]|uniref:Suppressor APC domain-containing protein 2 n=1 Tax=Triplophysa tibetana TaxID=1572043 RepID=A0A5A9P129_9TELE|nr:Suppressor APC domain-containing protein 2 [Triplophysa tibetana]